MNKPTAIDLLQDNGALAEAFIRVVLEDYDSRLALTRILSYHQLHNTIDNDESAAFMKKMIIGINEQLKLEVK